MIKSTLQIITEFNQLQDTQLDLEKSLSKLHGSNIKFEDPESVSDLEKDKRTSIQVLLNQYKLVKETLSKYSKLQWNSEEDYNYASNL